MTTTDQGGTGGFLTPRLLKVLSPTSVPSSVGESRSDSMKGNQARPWLTVKEAAQYASLSTDTIYTACERGELRHARVGGRRTIRLRPEWIDQWLERHARAPIGV